MLADGVEAAGFLCRESLEVHGPVLSAAPRSQVASTAVVGACAREWAALPH